MTPVDLIVTAPHFYTMTGKGLGYRSRSAIAVDRGRIIAIGPDDEICSAYRAGCLKDMPEHVILPGFIDAHMHMVDCLMRGLAQDTDQWMMHGISPFQMHMDREKNLVGVKLGIAEGLAAGTTCYGEFSDYDHDIMKFIEKSGVRACMTVRIREAVERIYEAGELYEFEQAQGLRSLEQCLSAHDKWQGKAQGRITVMFGPQGPDFVSTDLLKRIYHLSAERDARIHMHLQQGDRETWQVVKRTGRRPIAYMDEAGLLNERLIAVHLTDADEQEAALVARRGASMILCSGSIGIIDGIVPPAKAFQDGGGSVALGSDQAPGNNCHNMFNEMKLTALFNKIRFQNPMVMPAWKVLKMATIEGAKAIGMDGEIGSLEPGKQADFIAVNLKALTMGPLYTQPMRNIVPNLVYSARGPEVSMTVVAGQILYENGQHLTVNSQGILDQAGKSAIQLGLMAEKSFKAINGSSARMMEQGLL